MKPGMMLRRAEAALGLFGMRPRELATSVAALPWFLRSYEEFRKNEVAGFPVERLIPCLSDRGVEAGVGNGQYFYQDLIVAQRIFKRSPRRHIDCGSRIDGFVAHVAAFREIEVLDIRPLTTQAPNIRSVCADLMSNTHGLDGSTDSLSSLHALEHFGLGRYGDPIRPDGHLAALQNLADIVASGGSFYLSVPIGPQRVEFNAHRVFAVPYLVGLLEKHFEIRQLDFVDDTGRLHMDADARGTDASKSFGVRMGCGIFDCEKR